MTTNNLKHCAEAVLQQMGLEFTRENVEQDSLLAIALQHPMIADGAKLHFTEHYFYHEFMFFWFSAVELEAHGKFLSKMKLLFEVDIGPQSFDIESIIQMMQNYFLLVPTTRMKEVGIIPRFPPQQLESWYFERVDAVKLLQREAVATGVQAIPDKQNLSAGLAPRSTPYHHYLGSFSDAMVEAVGGEDDVMFLTAFETTVLIRRQFMFGKMQQILDEGLARLGIHC